MIRLMKKCPLLLLLIFSTLLLELWAVWGGLTGKYKWKITVDKPLFATVFLDDGLVETPIDEPIKDLVKEQPEAVNEGQRIEEKVTDIPASDTTQDSVQQSETSIQPEGQVVSGEDSFPLEEAASQQETPAVWKIAFEPRQPAPARSPYYDDPGKTPLTTDYPYIQVDASYYQDAVFIGDSRIEGLSDYGNIKEADFLYKRGLTIYNILEKKLETGSGSVGLKQHLSSKSYGKVFIMCGINELGRGTSAQFGEQYKKILDEIRVLQPQAAIIVMGIMNVSQSYSDKSEVFNNDNINSRNCAVAEQINGEEFFYFDMNEAVCDAEGGLKEEYTYDGIHLQAHCYQLWADWLNAHGISEIVK